MNYIFSDMAWRAAGRLKDMFISSIFWVYILFYIIVDRRSSNISLPTVSNDVKEEKIRRDEIHILVDTKDVSRSTSSTVATNEFRLILPKFRPISDQKNLKLRPILTIFNRNSDLP